MLKLMKYEFRKQLTTKFLLLAVLGLLEIYFLYGVFSDNMDKTMRAVILLATLAFAGIFFVSFECIMTYYNDLKTKQSYMLFMVPQSTFSVMGAKILYDGPDCYDGCRLWGCGIFGCLCGCGTL